MAPLVTSRVLSALSAVLLPLTDRAEELPPAPPVQALSPAEEEKTFQLPPGYRLELVLSEPVIKEPVVCAFDGNGRMFVAEMRTYMQDIDGTEELTPQSRVSLHTDTDGDGRFDRHTVFADGLLLPRMILPLGDGQLVIGETNTLDLYLHTDTDGNGIADKKELWFSGGPRGGNLEHQPSGLIWAMDNWIYTSYNSFRLRWTPGGVIRENIPGNEGQWGLGQDEHGKPWFMNAGGERGPVNFQVPIVYGNIRVDGDFAPGFAEVWPLVGRADVQGGPIRYRKEDGTLNYFTATSGVEIYRGDQLPAELRGNLFFGEPVGRLVRRALVEVKNGVTTLSNPYQAAKSEFIRSTDLCFRPLNMVTAPDGTLYIVDMYRGIIQEGAWVNEGSYLRSVVRQHSFDKVIGRGRIWRLVHTSTKSAPQPKMFSASSAELVGFLDHPNGWWRETAQKLLVLGKDRGPIPALLQLARENRNYLGRLHALWTLEGLGAADAAVFQAALQDAHPAVRAAAIRVGEALVQGGDKTVGADLLRAANDPDPLVVVQSMLTAQRLDLPGFGATIKKLVATTNAEGVKAIANQILHPKAPQPAPPRFTAEENKIIATGAEIFNMMCFTCHGPDGKGVVMEGAAPGTMLAPPLAGSKTVNGHPDGTIKVLLHGMVGEIDEKKYEGQMMVPMADNDDQWIAAVLSYVRNSFDNHASIITEQNVARVRAANRTRTEPWTIAELRASLPKPVVQKGWKLTASHNAGQTSLAIDGKAETRYTTGTSQVPGMWFQIELPQETVISGLQLDAASSSADYPREYRVELSADGANWGKPVAAGKGRGPATEIALEPAPARFIRITQTGAVEGLFWSIHELQVFAPPTATLAKDIPRR